MYRTLMAAVLGMAFCTAANAADERIGLELNKLEQRDGACRAYVVIENGTASRFDTLSFDLVMFDRTGVVAERLALETAPLPPAKTSLKVFDVPGLPCESVGRVLVNEVLACGDEQGAREDCLSRVETSARGDLALIK